MTTSRTPRLALAFIAAAIAAGTIVGSAASAGNGPSLSFGSQELVFAPSVLGVDDFAISPDGTRLAMQTNDPTNALQTFDPEDASPSPTPYASDGADTAGTMMAWSPDSSQIAFMHGNDTGFTDLDTVSAGGHPKTHASWWLYESYFSDDGHLAWLDDSHVASVAFADANPESDGAGPELVSVATDGSGNTVLTDGDGSPVGVPLSNGRTTVFQWTRTGYDGSLWMLDGSTHDSLTQVAGPDQGSWAQPRLSPDGTKVAYNDGLLEIYDIATQTTTPICPGHYNPSSFSWSPDGSNVAMDNWTFLDPVDSTTLVNQITVCPTDGGDPTVAYTTNMDGGVEYLQWSPNGDQIWWLNYDYGISPLDPGTVADAPGLYRMSVSSN
jgi:Tol biopolymer transport system component